MEFDGSNYNNLSAYDGGSQPIQDGSTLGKWVIRGAREKAQPAQALSRDPYLQNRKYTVLITKHNAIHDRNAVLTIVGAVPKEFMVEHGSTWASPWGGGLMGKGFAGDLMAIMKGNRLLTQTLSLQVWQGSADDTSFSVAFDLIAYDDAELDVMKPLRDLMSLVLPRLDEATGFMLSPGATIKPSVLAALGSGLGTLVGEGAAAVGAAIATGANKALELTKSKLSSQGSDSIDAQSRRMLNGEGSTFGGIARETADNSYAGASNAIAKSGLGLKKTIEAQMENIIQVNIGDWFEMENCVITDVKHTLSSQLPGQDGGVLHATVSVTFRPMFALTDKDMDTLLRGKSTA